MFKNFSKWTSKRKTNMMIGGVCVLCTVAIYVLESFK